MTTIPLAICEALPPPQAVHCRPSQHRLDEHTADVSRWEDTQDTTAIPHKRGLSGTIRLRSGYLIVASRLCATPKTLALMHLPEVAQDLTAHTCHAS